MPRSLPLALAVVVIAATACTHHHQVPILPSALPGDRVFVREPDGTEVEQSADAAAMAIAPIAVERVNRSRGLLEGFGMGALVGIGIGAAVGYAGGDDPPPACEGQPFCFDIRWSAEDKARFGAIGGGAIGAATGALLGLLIGSRDRYEITAAPSPGGATATLAVSF